MARFEIEANGKRYEVEAPDIDAAMAALGGGGAQTPRQQFGTAFDEGADDPRLAQSLAARATGREPAGFNDRFNNAVTMGLSKDAAALARTGPREVASWFTGDDYDFTGEYSRARSGERARLDEYATNNPGMAMTADITGAVGGAARTIPQGFANAVTLPGRIWQGAKAGGVGGGITGFGESESNGIAQRAMDAGEGLTAGGAIGGVFPVATAAVGAVARPFVDAAKARINPAGYAAEKLYQRATANGRTIDQTANRIERGQQIGQNLSFADAGTKKTRDLVRTVANIPGAGAERVTARTNLSAMSQGERLKKYVGEVFGSPGEGYQAAKAMVMDRRASAATPYYERAWKTPVPYTFELEGLLNTPAGRSALSAAKTNTANRREPWAQFFAQVGDDGTIQSLQRVPDSRALDEVKRSLDAMVEAAKKPADGSPFAKAMHTPESRAIQSVRDDLVSFLKTNNKPYERALEVAGDNIRADEALEFGRNALNEDSRVIARKMGDPTAYGRDKVFDEGDKELARLGLAEALRKKIDSAGWTENALLKFFRNPEQAARLKPFFRTQEEFTRFRGQIINEARKRRTVNAVRGNSTTTQQLADMQEAGQLGETAAVGAQALTGGPMAAALSALTSGLRRMGGLTPQVADQMAKMLMSADPQKVRGILTQIRQIEASKLSAAAQRGRVRALLTQFAAGQSGRALGSTPNGSQVGSRMLPAPAL